jgi:DNA-directed RNA polymerase specialized sigma24 family protein
MTDQVAPRGSLRAEGHDLQPRAILAIPPSEDVSHPGLLDALARVEDGVAARRLQKLQHDYNLLLHLQLSDFDVASPEWRMFQNVLVEYGYSVFVGWGISGQLRRRAAAHGRGGVFGLSKLPEGLVLSREDAHDLATELMLVAIVRFREKTLMHPDPSRRWTVTGGASLKTYFVGRCLMELPDVYSKLRLQSDMWSIPPAAPVDNEHPSLRRVRPTTRSTVNSTGHDHTDHAAFDAVELAALEAADPVAVAMFRLQSEGYSYLEIAEILDTTEGVVRTTMTRFRRRRNAS